MPPMGPVGSLYMSSHTLPHLPLTSLHTACLPLEPPGAGSAPNSRPALLEYPELDYQEVLIRVCCVNNLCARGDEASYKEWILLLRGRRWAGMGGLVSWGYTIRSGIVSHVDIHIPVFSEKQNSEKY